MQQLLLRGMVACAIIPMGKKNLQPIQLETQI